MGVPPPPPPRGGDDVAVEFAYIVLQHWAIWNHFTVRFWPGQTSRLKFSVIFSTFGYMTTIFPVDQVSNASQKTLKRKGMQRENKHGDPIFLLHFKMSCSWILIVPSLTEIWKVRNFHVNYLYSPAARSSYRLQMLQFIRQMFNPCFDIHQSLISSVQTILRLCATEANNGEKNHPLFTLRDGTCFFILWL